MQLSTILIAVSVSISTLSAAPWDVSAALSTGDTQNIILSEVLLSGVDPSDHVNLAYFDRALSQIRLQSTQQMGVNAWFFAGSLPGSPSDRFAMTGLTDGVEDVDALFARNRQPAIFIACVEGLPCLLPKTWAVYGDAQLTPTWGNAAFRTVDILNKWPATASYFAFADEQVGGKLTVAMTLGGSTDTPAGPFYPWHVLGSAGFSPTSVSELSLYTPRNLQNEIYAAYVDASGTIRVFKFITFFRLNQWVQVGPALTPPGSPLHLDLAVEPVTLQPYVVFSTLSGPGVARLNASLTAWETIGTPQTILGVDCTAIDFSTLSREPLIGCSKFNSLTGWFPMVLKFKQNTWVSLGDINEKMASPNFFSDMDMTYSTMDDGVWIAFRSYSGDNTGQIKVAHKTGISL